MSWAAALTAGASIVGGLLGSRDRTQTTRSEVDYVKMRKSAEAAGFNPLTALQNGGSAGFSTSTTTVPGLSSAEALANAVGGGVETYFNTKAQERDVERDLLEMEVMRAELADMQENNRVVTDRDFGYSIPNATNITGVTSAPSAPALSGSGTWPHGPDGRSIRNTQLDPWYVDPRWDKAEKVEQEYSDIPGNLYGVGKVLHDFGWNLGTRVGAWRLRRSIADAYRKRGAQPSTPAARPKPRPPYLSGTPYARRWGRLGTYP